MLDSRPMTGQVFSLVWKESSSMSASLIYSFCYSSCSSLLQIELYAFWKAVWPCSPREVHTKSPSCDQMNVGALWASWCRTRIQQVPLGAYTGLCWWSTDLEMPTWSICRAVRSLQAARHRFCTRFIGSNRPADLVRNMYGPAQPSGSFTALWLEDEKALLSATGYPLRFQNCAKLCAG